MDKKACIVGCCALLSMGGIILATITMATGKDSSPSFYEIDVLGQKSYYGITTFLGGCSISAKVCLTNPLTNQQECDTVTSEVDGQCCHSFNAGFAFTLIGCFFNWLQFASIVAPALREKTTPKLPMVFTLCCFVCYMISWAVPLGACDAGSEAKLGGAFTMALIAMSDAGLVVIGPLAQLAKMEEEEKTVTAPADDTAVTASV